MKYLIAVAALVCCSSGEAGVVYDLVKIGNHDSEYSGQIEIDVELADLPTTVNAQDITRWEFEIDGDRISNPEITTTTSIFGDVVVVNGVRMAPSFPMVATEDGLTLPGVHGAYLSFVEPRIVGNQLQVQAVNLFHSTSERYHYSLDDEEFRFQDWTPIDGSPVLVGTLAADPLVAEQPALASVAGCVVPHSSPAIVPEPSAVALAIFALGAAWQTRKHRKW